MQITVSLGTPAGSCPACPLKVEPGITAEALFHQTVGGDSGAYRALVNGGPVPWGHIVQDEDRVTFKALPE